MADLATHPGYCCCTFRGSAVAFDSRTGRMLWRTYTLLRTTTGSSLLFVATGDYYPVPPGVVHEARPSWEHQAVRRRLGRFRSGVAAP